MSKLLMPFKFIYKFFVQVFEEGKKAVWPTRNDVFRGTVTVTVTVAISVFVFAGFDWLLQKGLIYILEK